MSMTNEIIIPILRSEVLEDFTDEIIDLYHALIKEKESFTDMGIDFEEKAFYDILKDLARRYDFTYPEDKLFVLAREVKKVVDDISGTTLVVNPFISVPDMNLAPVNALNMFVTRLYTALVRSTTTSIMDPTARCAMIIQSE